MNTNSKSTPLNPHPVRGEEGVCATRNTFYVRFQRIPTYFLFGLIQGEKRPEIIIRRAMLCAPERNSSTSAF